jgi:hypothetical protein
MSVSAVKESDREREKGRERESERRLPVEVLVMEEGVIVTITGGQSARVWGIERKQTAAASKGETIEYAQHNKNIWAKSIFKSRHRFREPCT